MSSPKSRPLERFWPYAELPEQPTDEELAALNPEALKVVQQSSLGETLGRARMFFNLPSAVQQYERTHSSVAT